MKNNNNNLLDNFEGQFRTFGNIQIQTEFNSQLLSESAIAAVNIPLKVVKTQARHV